MIKEVLGKFNLKNKSKVSLKLTKEFYEKLKKIWQVEAPTETFENFLIYILCEFTISHIKPLSTIKFTDNFTGKEVSDLVKVKIFTSKKGVC